MGKLFLLFAIMPIVEISLLLNVGDLIGGWNTVGIVIFTAFVGAYLVRQQGLSTLMQAQSKMQTGNMPGQEMAEGLLLVVAGVLLVTPGFITDGIGFLFSLPFTRPAIAKSLLRYMTVRVVASQSQQQSSFYQHGQPQRSEEGDIIEGEFEAKESSIDQNKLDKPE